MDGNCRNLPSRKTRSCLFHMVSIMAADDLTTQGVRASAAMILTMSVRNIPLPTIDGKKTTFNQYFHLVFFRSFEIINKFHDFHFCFMEAFDVFETDTFALRRHKISSHKLCFSFTGLQNEQKSFVNPLRAKFLRKNINIYLHFMSFLHNNKTQVAEIPPWVRPRPAYST